MVLDQPVAREPGQVGLAQPEPEALHAHQALDSPVRVAQAARVELTVRPVPVAQPLQPVALAAQVQAQPVVAVAALAVEPQVPSEREALVVRARLVSRSVQSVKSLNLEVPRALVAQLCHAATETLSFACVVDPRSKTSQTRLTPMPVS